MTKLSSRARLLWRRATLLRRLDELLLKAATRRPNVRRSQAMLKVVVELADIEAALAHTR